MWSRDKLSQDGPSPRIILSQRCRETAHSSLGLAPSADAEDWAVRWSELLSRTSRPASLALNVEELKPGAPQLDRPSRQPIHSFWAMHPRVHA